VRKLAHIVNPVAVGPGSDLYEAQPIVFEAMERARQFAAGDVAVDFFTAQYPEDRGVAPPVFVPTRDLSRSVADVARFRVERKLPILADILERLYEASDAEYLVYTNVDVILMPSFYSTVNRLIDTGHDGFVINRRSLPAVYHTVSDLPGIYADLGEIHLGWDTFVFSRSLFPSFDLGTACLGAPRIGMVLLSNIARHAREFREFKHLHLTAHIGDSMTWFTPEQEDYRAHNTRQLAGVLDKLLDPQAAGGSMDALVELLTEIHTYRHDNTKDIFDSLSRPFGEPRA